MQFEDEKRDSRGGNGHKMTRGEITSQMIKL